MKGSELIVMLTNNDRTVSDAIDVFEASKNTPARFWGFKEEGIPLAEMKDLVKRMKAAGKTTFLEVVDYTEEGCLAGVDMCIECGFDILMGTLFFPSILDRLKATSINYMPFVGQIHGRPSILEGSIDGMIEEANKLVELGVYGIDLLAYRYTGDANELIKRFVKEVNCPVCIAGSINTYERLDRMKEYRPWSFTIGSAFFNNEFGAGLTFGEQIAQVTQYMDKQAGAFR